MFLIMYIYMYHGLLNKTFLKKLLGFSLSSLKCPLSTIYPYSITYILSYSCIFSNLWVITSNALSLVYSNNLSCNFLSVSGSILDVASSKHTISTSYIKILKKLITYFSPFDKLRPDFYILKSKFMFSYSFIFISWPFYYASSLDLLTPLTYNPLLWTIS